MIKKNWLTSSISLVLAMMLLVAGCSDGNSGTGAQAPSSGDNGGKADSNNSAPAEKPLDKVTFSYFNGVAAAKDMNTNETTIGKILEDQTGVNFKIEHLVGDLKTKVGTMIAANDFPDVMIPDAAIDQVLDAGAFIDLLPLIEAHGPNIKMVYGPYFDMMKNEDGEILFLPFSNVVNEEIPDPNINQGAFWVQRRVLDWAGYPKIRTLDEYMKLIEDYEAAHKSEDLTGIVTLTHDWRFFATANPPMHLKGYPNDGNVIVDMNTFEAKTYNGSEETKLWLQSLNDMNAKGLFDKASFVDNFDQYIAKLTSGKVLGFFDYGWQIANAQNALKDAARQDPSKDGLVYFPLPVTFDGGKNQYLDPAGFTKNRGMGITVSAKDPARIIQYLDTLMKEENQILVRWGIKGETYDVNAEGRFYRTPEMITMIDESFNEKFGFKYYSWNWPQWGTGSTLSDGNALSPGNQAEVFQMSLTEKDKEILDKYGVKTYAEMFDLPEERPWFPAWGIPKEQGSPQQTWETKKDELTKKYFPRLVLATPDRFESVWNEYLAEWNKLDTADYESWTTAEIAKLIEINSVKK